LVSDNFEQVLETVSTLSKLLEASGLRVLGLQPHALKLYAEREYTVLSFSDPNLERLPNLAALSQ
jgi:hypothetical protein